MKENVKLVEENVEYKMLNGFRKKYNLYKVKIGSEEVSVTRDTSIEMNFTEQFRPRVLDELIMVEAYKKRFRSWINQKIIPDVLMYEPLGGVGKTTTTQVLINESKSDFLCLSANINRGVSAIRDEVVPFCENKTMYGDRKLVSIEEIGDATSAQVDSLKSVFDKYNSNVSLILTTNSLSNITTPLKKRFEFFDFSKYTKEQEQELTKQTYLRVMAILAVQGVDYEMADIKYVVGKYKLSFREIIKTIGNSIVDNKLDIQKTAEGTIENKEIFQAINNKDIEELVKLSDKINPIHFLEDMSLHFTNYLKSAEYIMPFIINLNTYQNEINSNVPFPNISFLNFCTTLTQDGISFKEV